jgi:ATP-dependent helicase HrpB
VLVIEPRRIACRTLAGWVARGLGQEVGGKVGFSVRFEQRTSDSTKILFVTPGVARRFLSDGSLSRYAMVIFDEFHERSWETDTVMAALAAGGGQQRLLLMSATLAADRLVSVYGASRVECLGRSFPVEVSYRSDGELTVPTSVRLVDRVTRAIEDSWDRQGGTLVFLPGLAAMREVRQRLPRLPIVLLHGSYSHQDQDSAFATDGAPRIVLATNVAESSLTLPDITTVIDSGLEKRPVHQSGYVALATVPIATSSAEQRAGRAGRTGPGRCLRLWDEKARLEASRPPDLERMELDELVLFLACLPAGLNTPLTWVDQPPGFAWERALSRLQQKALIDDAGLATALGRAVARLPVDTEWARLLAQAPAELQPALCDLHALASGRRGLMKPQADQEQVECRKKELGDEPWRRSLSILRLGEAARHGLDKEALEEARRLSKELQEALGLHQACPSSGVPHGDLAMFLAQHWPERHFVRRQNRDAWANGTVECHAARGEELSPECQAALFLQVEPVIARGLKVELRGRWALPSSPAFLRRAGYGRPELSKIRLRDGKVSANVAWTYAGRVLTQEERELDGPALREALAQLARQGSWMKGLWDSWEEHLFYLALGARLGDGREPSDSAETLLLRHLGNLGVEKSEDLELLEPADLQPPAADESLRKSYPRQYLYGGVVYDVSYRLGRVLLRWRSGPRGAKLSAQHLPRWNGWAVDLEERGRLTPLR